MDNDYKDFEHVTISLKRYEELKNIIANMEEEKDFYAEFYEKVRALCKSGYNESARKVIVDKEHLAELFAAYFKKSAIVPGIYLTDINLELEIK